MPKVTSVKAVNRPADMPGFWTVDDVCVHLNCGRGKIYRQLHQRLKKKKVGDRVEITSVTDMGYVAIKHGGEWRFPPEQFFRPLPC